MNLAIDVMIEYSQITCLDDINVDMCRVDLSRCYHSVFVTLVDAIPRGCELIAIQSDVKISGTYRI